MIAIHSYGHDPGMEIIKKVWPNDNPFVHSRHDLLKEVKHDLGAAGVAHLAAFMAATGPQQQCTPKRQNRHPTHSIDCMIHSLSENVKYFVLALIRRHQFIDGSREEPVVKGHIIQGGRGRHKHHVVERCDQYTAVKKV